MSITYTHKSLVAAGYVPTSTTSVTIPSVATIQSIAAELQLPESRVTAFAMAADGNKRKRWRVWIKPLKARLPISLRETLEVVTDSLTNEQAEAAGAAVAGLLELKNREDGYPDRWLTARGGKNNQGLSRSVLSLIAETLNNNTNTND